MMKKTFITIDSSNFNEFKELTTKLTRENKKNINKKVYWKTDLDRLKDELQNNFSAF